MVWVTSEKNDLQTDFEGKNTLTRKYLAKRNSNTQKKHLSRRVLLGKKSYTLHVRKKILLLRENVYSNQITHTPPPPPPHPKVKWSVPKILERQVQPGRLLIQLSVRLQTVPLLRWAPDMDNDLLSGLFLISFPESFSPC